MEFLDVLFQIMVVIFVIGSSAAGWWKKRQEQGQQRQAGPPPPDPGPVELDFELEEEEGPGAPFAPFLAPRPVARQLPPVPPVPAVRPVPAAPPASARTVGDLESALERRDFGTASFSQELDDRFDRATFADLADELDDRRLGQLEATAAAEIDYHVAWRPSSSWREAMILREVMAAPLALRETGQPGVPS